MVQTVGEEENKLEQAGAESSLIVETSTVVFVFEEISPFSSPSKV